MEQKFQKSTQTYLISVLTNKLRPMWGERTVSSTDGAGIIGSPYVEV